MASRSSRSSPAVSSLPLPTLPAPARRAPLHAPRLRARPPDRVGSRALPPRLRTAPTPTPQGLLPTAFDEGVHLTRCLQQLRSKDKNIEKYIYLAQLKDADPNMFYRVCVGNMAVSLPFPPSPLLLPPSFLPSRPHTSRPCPYLGRARAGPRRSDSWDWTGRAGVE